MKIRHAEEHAEVPFQKHYFIVHGIAAGERGQGLPLDTEEKQYTKIFVVVNESLRRYMLLRLP